MSRVKNRKVQNARFLARSLSNLVDNLVEGIHKIKCKDCSCTCSIQKCQ